MNWGLPFLIREGCSNPLYGDDEYCEAYEKAQSCQSGTLFLRWLTMLTIDIESEHAHSDRL